MKKNLYHNLLYSKKSFEIEEMMRFENIIQQNIINAILEHNTKAQTLGSSGLNTAITDKLCFKDILGLVYLLCLYVMS